MTAVREQVAWRVAWVLVPLVLGAAFGALLTTLVLRLACS